VNVFRRFAHAVSTHPKTVLISSLVVFTIAGAVGSAVIGRMSGGGYSDLNSDSYKVFEILRDDFAVKDPYLTLAIGDESSPNSVDTDRVQSEVQKVIDEISAVDGVESVSSYWTLGKPEQLKSADGELALVMVYLSGDSVDKNNRISKNIVAMLPEKDGALSIYPGGAGAIMNGINGRITEDIKFAEMISIPLTILMLLVVFGTAVAAGMPMVVAFSAIAGALLAVLGVSQFTDVSVFALNLITGLGMGLGIDYALLIVNRFREELGRGASVDQAVKTTVQTAGHTVMISGFTVALTLGSLIVFPQTFLKSFAYGGVAVCLTAVAGAVIPLPAALRLLGHRIDKLKIRRGDLTPKDEGGWSRIAHFVMRRPWLTVIGTVAVLVSLATPAVTAQFSQVDDRVLPASDRAAVSAQVLRERFTSNESTPIEVLLPVMKNSDEIGNADYALRASAFDHVVRVEAPQGIAVNGAWIPLAPGTPWPMTTMQSGEWIRLRMFVDVGSRTPTAQDVITQLRDLNSSALVGGGSADYTDSQNGVAHAMPKALLWIAIATLIVLFLYTGSVVLPIKAVLLNVLSLGATLGVLTWMFEDGNLQWLTGGYTVTGTLDTSTLVLIGIVTFGLSMDYEVFLLSRIKEEHDKGSDTVEAVALGLQRSGRIITAAALLLAVVFAAFVTSGVTSIKMMGFGIAFAILLDASVVRGLLVPALMRIAGKYNWWAPRPLLAIHNRFGLKD
jgi:RND superfamily putative drug exporter